MEINGREFPTNRIRKWRKFRGFKQETLRKKLGLESRSVISNWENGITNPNPQELFDLAEILQCEIRDLYPEHEAKAKEKYLHHEKSKEEKYETYNDGND